MKTHVRFAKRHTRRYQEFTRNAYLDGADVLTEEGNIAVYNRLLFALLSVNTSYATSAKAYTAMSGKYWRDGQEIMAEYMRHGVHYAGARAGYLAEATERFIEDPIAFIKRQDESWNEYRFRLVKLIPGLSFCKVSFFIGMIYRNADVCCLDRWMLRSLGIKNVDKALSRLSKPYRTSDRMYRRLESTLRNKNKTDLSLPAFQWAVWDSIQKQSNAMEVLAQ